MLTKPRYASSNSSPPVHLATLVRHEVHGGLLIFHLNNTDTEAIPFNNQAQLHQLLQKLINAKVPLSVGGHIGGPCEEVCRLIDAGTLQGTALQLAWRGPSLWTIRELQTGTMAWELANDPEEIANCAFDPTSLHKMD